jgi:hypothetical protein
MTTSCIERSAVGTYVTTSVPVQVTAERWELGPNGIFKTEHLEQTSHFLSQKLPSLDHLNPESTLFQLSPRV